MLIDFSVSNFRSFKEKQTLSLVSSTDPEHESNVISPDLPGLKGVNFLKSLGVYGANASGKSNLVRSLSFMADFVTNSFTKYKPKDLIKLNPFLLDSSCLDKPSQFEITFTINDVRYDYGFSLTKERVTNEWLNSYKNGYPALLFNREYNGGETDEYKFGRSLRDHRAIKGKTRPNALFVSVAAQFNHEQLAVIYNWFSTLLIITQVPNTLENIIIPDLRKRGSLITEKIKKADLGIFNLEINPIDPEDLKIPEDAPQNFKDGIRVLVESGDLSKIQPIRLDLSTGEEISLDINDESDGTKRLINLLGPWYLALDNGLTIFIDEIESSMHPLLVKSLIEMFNSKENINGAQLVYTTHDTTLLDLNMIRRDQIWFTEKDSGGATKLYPLTDFSPRINEALQKGYLAGRYGAIPFLTKEMGLDEA